MQSPAQKTLGERVRTHLRQGLLCVALIGFVAAASIAAARAQAPQPTPSRGEMSDEQVTSSDHAPCGAIFARL